MRFLTFEKFTDNTIKRNNSEYNIFLNRKERKDKVAWGGDSQSVNFNLVGSYIKSGVSLLDYGCGIGDFKGYLDSKKIKISNYMGVDINPNFIDLACKSYPNEEFELIKSIDDVKGQWDIICAIGVFTWYISKQEFISTIRHLYKLCNNYLLITVLYGTMEGWHKNYQQN